MNEKLLQFIWQFQYFNKSGLATVDGGSLKIIHPGFANTNQGPDFLEARIKTDDTEWAGNIEIHTQASHWNNHKHSGDTNYTNVILHVVWINDTPIKDGNHQLIATLELHNLVPKIMLQHYEQLMQAKGFVPCENYLPALTEIGWLSWKERLVVERLQRKSENILIYLQQSNNHWEEVLWWLKIKYLRFVVLKLCSTLIWRCCIMLKTKDLKKLFAEIQIVFLKILCLSLQKWSSIV